MKELIIVTIFVVIFCGCYEPQKDSKGSFVPNAEGVIIIEHGNYVARIDKVNIEGHEYLVMGSGHRGGICHSENCPCKTRNNINTKVVREEVTNGN